MPSYYEEKMTEAQAWNDKFDAYLALYTPEVLTVLEKLFPETPVEKANETMVTLPTTRYGNPTAGNCDVCTLPLIIDCQGNNAFLSTTLDGTPVRVCNASCASDLACAWGLPFYPATLSDIPAMPVLPSQDGLQSIFPADMDIDRDNLEKLNLALSSCEKQGMGVDASLPDAALDTLFTTLTGQYSPFCPAVVPYSIARDFRLALGYASGAFVLAVGSVMLFHHLLF